MSEYYRPGGGLMPNLGAAADGGAQPLTHVPAIPWLTTEDAGGFPRLKPGVVIAWYSVSLVSMGACVYHGYKRNNSVGWAIAWGLLGGLFPIITPIIAVAQGFGKPRVTRNRRRRSSRRS